MRVATTLLAFLIGGTCFASNYVNGFTPVGALADPTTKYLRGDNTWQPAPVGATGVPGTTGSAPAGATGATGGTGATGATGSEGHTVTWLASPDTVGDWPAGTVTSDTDVDLTDDSVAAGSVGVILSSYASDTAVVKWFVGPSSRATTDYDAWGGSYTWDWGHCTIVQLNTGEVLHVKHVASNSITTNYVNVLAYIK